jgi:hypothetical protein
LFVYIRMIETQTNVCNMNERNIMHRSYTRTYMYHASRVKLFRDNLKRNRCIMNDDAYEYHKRAIRASIAQMRVTRQYINECVQS